MAAARVKLNPSLVVRLSATRVTIKENPRPFPRSGVFFLSAVTRTLTSLRYASAMMLLLNRRVIKKVRIQTRVDSQCPSDSEYWWISLSGAPIIGELLFSPDARFFLGTSWHVRQWDVSSLW